MSARLFIPDARSLKTKRQALRSIKDTLRSRFNVSVAEVGDQDLWQTAELGVCAVGTDRAYVEGLLNQALRVMKTSRSATLIGSRMEFV